MRIFKKICLFIVLGGFISACSGKMTPTNPPPSNPFAEFSVDGLPSLDSPVPPPGQKEPNQPLSDPPPDLNQNAGADEPPDSAGGASLHVARDPSDCPLAGTSSGGQPVVGQGRGQDHLTTLDEIFPFSDREAVSVPRRQPSPARDVHEGIILPRQTPCEQEAQRRQQASQPGPSAQHGDRVLQQPPLPPPASANARRLVKVLFVVDKTEKNRQSDIDGDIRTHIVRQAYDAHKSEGWYSWGMVTFEGEEARGDTAEYRISTEPDGKGDAIFTTNHQLVERAIDHIRTGADEGRRVRYKPAIDRIRNLIGDDLKKPTQGGTHYAVLFIASTRPRDRRYGGLPPDREVEIHGGYNEDRLRTLDNDIQDIVNLGRRGYNNKVTVSTFYYGVEHLVERHYLGYRGGTRNSNPHPPDHADPRLILQRMARVGGGRYLYVENQVASPSAQSSTGSNQMAYRSSGNDLALMDSQNMQGLDGADGGSAIGHDVGFYNRGQGLGRTSIPASQGFQWFNSPEVQEDTEDETEQRPTHNLSNWSVWRLPDAQGNPLDPQKRILSYQDNFGR